MSAKSHYATPDMAAIAALNEVSPRSRGENREFAGMIYMNMDGSFSHTAPIPGGFKSMPAAKAHPVKGTDWDWYPPGSNLAGWYHSHGRFTTIFNEHALSGSRMIAGQPGDTDIGFHGVFVAAYVGMPGRKIGEQGNKIVKYTRHSPRPRPSDFTVLQGPQSFIKECIEW